jgi:hypothetical protein
LQQLDTTLLLGLVELRRKAQRRHGATIVVGVVLERRQCARHRLRHRKADRRLRHMILQMLYTQTVPHLTDVVCVTSKPAASNKLNNAPNITGSSFNAVAKSSQVVDCSLA